MNTIVVILGYIVGLFCTVISLYQVWVCLGVFIKKKRAIPEHPDTTRIAAIIAARNEENVVGALVKSLLAQKYPRELFDIYVVPNNCKDNTEAAARAAGALILHPTSSVHCKGDVLHQTFEQLSKTDKYDVFCVFDADNLTDPGFFHQANNAFQAGYDCAQGCRRSKNPTESWVAGSMTVFYQFMSSVFNESRWRRGLSAHLNGTGIMVSRHIISKFGWNTDTLTEDLEFTGRCALNGVSIAWMRNAIVYDEQPTGFKCSCVQRRRWTAGSMQCTWRLAWKLVKKGTRSAFDIGMLFTCNLMNYLGVLGIPLTIFNPQTQALLKSLSLGGIALLGLAYVAAMWIVLSLAAYVMLRIAGIQKGTEPTILLFPVFMASWTVVNLWASFTKAPGWKHIEHNSKQVPEALRNSAAVQK